MPCVPYLLNFSETTGSYSLMSYHPYHIFCISMKLEGHTLCDVMSSLPYFVCYDVVKKLYQVIICHLYLTFNFNELIWSYPLIICHPYFTFCVLMKWRGHTLWRHANHTLYFEFYWNYRLIPFDDMLSVSCFLCFDEIIGSHGLMAHHPYHNFCVLMKL